MLNEKIIRNLEAKGFKRWTKNGMDRLYISAQALGMDRETYQYRGERVSNGLAGKILNSKYFIDVNTGKISSPVGFIEKDLAVMLDEATEAAEAADAEAVETEAQAVEEPAAEPVAVVDEAEHRRIERTQKYIDRVLAAMPAVDPALIETDEIKARYAAPRKPHVLSVYTDKRLTPLSKLYQEELNILYTMADRAKDIAAHPDWVMAIEQYADAVYEREALLKLRREWFGE